MAARVRDIGWRWAAWHGGRRRPRPDARGERVGRRERPGPRPWWRGQGGASAGHRLVVGGVARRQEAATAGRVGRASGAAWAAGAEAMVARAGRRGQRQRQSEWACGWLERATAERRERWEWQREH